MKKIIVAVGTGRPGTRVHKHAGRSKHFLLYEIVENEKGEIELKDKKQIELTDDQILHEVLHREPLSFKGHPLEKAEIIITGGIGPGAVQKLYFLGKRAYMVAEKNPDEVIEKLIAGTLQALPPERHHHHHHHDHHHHHHHDHDHEDEE